MDNKEKNQREEKEEKKESYSEPALVKHGKLRDITTVSATGVVLGCTRNVI